MAEDNDKLAKARGGDGKAIAIKGAITKPDTEQVLEKNTRTTPEVKPMKLPPKHQFKG